MGRELARLRDEESGHGTGGDDRVTVAALSCEPHDPLEGPTPAAVRDVWLWSTVAVPIAI